MDLPPSGSQLPGSQMDYDVGKARQQDAEARMQEHQTLADARSSNPGSAGGLWAWLRALFPRR